MGFLTEIEKLLDMTSADKVEIMRELTSHYEDLQREMVASGVEPAQAQAEAAHRLGTPSELAAQLNVAHNSASWRSALLCLVPFAASAVYLAATTLRLAAGVRLSLLIAIGVVMLAASARELLHSRRPLWLTTWLAAGLLCVPGVLDALGSIPPTAGMRAAAFATLILAALVLTIALATCRLLKTVVITCAVAVPSATCMLFGDFWLAVLVAIVSFVVLLVLAARLIFRADTYRSGLQATLFLLATFTLKLAEPARAAGSWAQVMAVLLCGLGIVLFTRSPRRGTKALACYCTLFVYAVAGDRIVTVLPEFSITWSTVLSAAVTAGVYQVIVCSPMMRVTREEVNRLTLAR